MFPYHLTAFYGEVFGAAVGDRHRPGRVGAPNIRLGALGSGCVEHAADGLGVGVAALIKALEEAYRPLHSRWRLARRW